MKADHANFSVKSSGLCLNTEYLHLGATPDGFISCSCCGEGLLEIKCPYKYKDIDLETISDESFYLQPSGDGSLHLSTDHDYYYYQVQGQLAVCMKSYCDFVCWTTKSIHIERI